MNSPLGPLARLTLALITGLTLAMGFIAVGCGPQKKFCADASDGICPDVVDAAPKPDVMDAPEEDKGSIFVND